VSDDPDDHKMPLMEHLIELRRRILISFIGFFIAFLVCWHFAEPIYNFLARPLQAAMEARGQPLRMVYTALTEKFFTNMKLSAFAAAFVCFPVWAGQLWLFVAPGLYKKERRWALPFVLLTAGLFITGGCFAYFLAFRYGLEFLLGIGMSNNVQPVVSITEYFDLFVNVTLGVGLVFELPVLIFMLTLLHVLSPRFLIRHSRYAILIIVIVAAIITPTPDVFNLMLFAIPMCALYFVGVFASYLLVLRREGRRLPWKNIIRTAIAVGLLIALIYGVMTYFHLHFIRDWPYFAR